ncbi:MAG: hypothetical protein K6B14_03125 [Lachnospiraceae bacterium]|nr:hypothetical protein [Lachnospiraceae bacterium]
MKRLRVLGIVLSAALLVTGAPQVLLEDNVGVFVYAANSEKNEVALESRISRDRVVNVYQAGEKTSNETTTLRYYKDLPHIPYIDIREYYKMFPGTLYDGFTVRKTGKNKFKVTNRVTLATAKVDTIADVFSSEDMAEFTNVMGLIQPGMDNSYLDGLAYVRYRGQKIAKNKSSAQSYDFESYGIDLRKGKDENGNLTVYMPLCTINDMTTDLAYHYILYIGGDDIYVCDDNRYGNVADNDPSFYKTIIGKGDKRPYTRAERELIYRELCFQIDHCYGYPGREIVDPNSKTKDFDAFLKSYKNKYVTGKKIRSLLMSDKWSKYMMGYDMVGVLLDDGGHTAISIASNTSKANDVVYDAYIKAYKDNPKLYKWYYSRYSEYIYKYTDVSSMTEQRKKGFGLKGNQYYVEKGDTAVCVFDTFCPTAKGMTAIENYYKTKKWPDASTCGEPMVKFVDSLKRAQANPNIKNFVLDITVNGGGSLDIVEAMMSLMLGSGKNYVKYDNPATGQKFTVRYDVDRNFDGVFDEKDKDVSYDLNFAILTSDYCFSCANLYPSLMKDNGILVMGRTSGGGACAIQKMVTPEGFTWQCSSARSRLIDKKGKCIDGGIEPDVDLLKYDKKGNMKTIEVETVYPQILEKADIADYSDFYNIDKLSEAINKYYKN